MTIDPLEYERGKKGWGSLYGTTLSYRLGQWSKMIDNCWPSASNKIPKRAQSPLTPEPRINAFTEVKHTYTRIPDSPGIILDKALKFTGYSAAVAFLALWGYTLFVDPNSRARPRTASYPSQKNSQNVSIIPSTSTDVSSIITHATSKRTLDLRTCPASTCEVFSQVPMGTSVEIKKIAAFGWAKIEVSLNGKQTEGFVNRLFLSTQKPQKAPTQPPREKQPDSSGQGPISRNILIPENLEPPTRFMLGHRSQIAQPSLV